ncbi:MAG: hypothetical protein HZA89_17795 [Verrucomicrobia bacterium]|nr:hypothetical protein [Verrucomicrobiota bacterium]
MRWLLSVMVIVLWTAAAAHAASGKVVKVLPHYLDQQGRHTLSPSLYERDAYQAHLRKHPAEVSTLRFDVQWRGTSGGLKIRIEARGRKNTPPLVLEQAVKSGAFSRWSEVALSREQYQQLGEVTAWRVTLWDDGQQLAESASFLW